MLLGKRKLSKKDGSAKVAKRRWEHSSDEDEDAEPTDAMKALQAELEDKERIQKENEEAAAEAAAKAKEEAEAAAKAAVIERKRRGTVRVWMDIALAAADQRLSKGEPIGRMTFELFTDDAPQTVENFRCLCTGEKGLGESGLPLHYLNNIFHRVVKGFMAQGGDITREDGSGGESIYGAHIQEEPAAFAAHSHDARGLLSMANAGPGTEASQFFVLFAEAPWLDGRHVVFGKLIDGEGVLASIEECGTPSGKPSRCIRIAACGQLQNEPTEAAEDGSGGDETADAAEGAQQDGQHAVNTADEEPQGEGKEDAAADAADGEPQEEEAGDNPP